MWTQAHREARRQVGDGAPSDQTDQEWGKLFGDVGGEAGCAKSEADAVGYDARKRLKGRKLHTLVDSESLLLRLIVHSAMNNNILWSKSRLN